ncbi:MAG: Ribosomal protein [Candidatus Parcubacteria bacterium]|jgi:ribosomal protein L29|nr:Ribosomal protein [Candidatus Parcubacteria bacterium]
MAKKTDIKQKDQSELNELLKSKREELRTLRFSIAGGRSKDGNALRKTRADVARIMTELGKRDKVA